MLKMFKAYEIIAIIAIFLQINKVCLQRGGLHHQNAVKSTQLIKAIIYWAF